MGALPLTRPFPGQPVEATGNERSTRMGTIPLLGHNRRAMTQSERARHIARLQGHILRLQSARDANLIQWQAVESSAIADATAKVHDLIRGDRRYFPSTLAKATRRARRLTRVLTGREAAARERIQGETQRFARRDNRISTAIQQATLRVVELIMQDALGGLPEAHPLVMAHARWNVTLYRRRLMTAKEDVRTYAAELEATPPKRPRRSIDLRGLLESAEDAVRRAREGMVAWERRVQELRVYEGASSVFVIQTWDHRTNAWVTGPCPVPLPLAAAEDELAIFLRHGWFPERRLLRVA